MSLQHPLFQVVSARLREFSREPAAIFWVYVFPLIMALALGLAFRDKPVEETVLVDVQQSAAAKQVAAALESHERFVVTVSEETEWRQRLKSGDTEVVVIADDATKNDENSTSPASDSLTNLSLSYVFDPTRPGSIVARDALDNALQEAAGREDRLTVADQEFKEPGGRYIDFLIPGLIGMSLMGGGLWGVGFSIVDMRIRKLLKRFVATPMRRSDFLGGILLSRIIFIIPEMILLLLFARFFFGVRISGDFFSLVVLILLGSLQFSGIGLLVASRAQTLETVSGLMNLTMVPMWIASGIFFKPENFPDFMQPFINVLPLTPLIRALRSVMNEGASLLSLGPEVALIIGWSVASFVAALAIFRWK